MLVEIHCQNVQPSKPEALMFSKKNEKELHIIKIFGLPNSSRLFSFSVHYILVRMKIDKYITSACLAEDTVGIK